MEKSASIIRSIVDIFSTQFKKNQSQDKRILFTSLLTIFQAKNTGEKVRKTRLELQTQAIHDLSKLLCFKTIQIDKSGHVLDLKSNLYQRYQIVQSFLQMQFNKKKDNPSLD